MYSVSYRHRAAVGRVAANRRGLLWLTYFLLFSLVLPCWTATAATIADRSILVWGEKNSQGNYAIQLSRLQDGQWTAAKVLSAGSGQNILPAVASDKQGTVWVAWTELQGIQGAIWYRFFTADGWSEPVGLKTATSSNMSPSLTVDGHGTAWLVYSGNDGGLDDVYAVHWTGDSWSEPVKVNADNTTPDILPRLTVDDHGAAVVSWQGYNGDQYVTRFSQWTGSGWSPEQEVHSGGSIAVTLEQSSLPAPAREQLKRNLPDFINDTSQAVLHFQEKEMKKTIRLKGQR